MALGMAHDLKWYNQSGPWEFAGNVGTWTLFSLVNGRSYFCCSHSEELEAGRREEGLHHAATKE